MSAVALKISAMLRIFPASFARIDVPGVRIACIAIWATGTAILLLNWYKRLRAGYSFVGDPHDGRQQALDRARNRLGMSTPVRLRISAAEPEPGLIGILHPTVIVPKDLSSRLTSEEFEAVLLHEVAHAVRRDNLAAAFVHVLVCIFWFHPLLWLVERRLTIERERACDAMVIASGVTPRVYIAGILKVCKFNLFEPVAGVSAIGGSGLQRRVDMILSLRPGRRSRRSYRLLLASLALVMALLPIANGYCEQCVSNGQGAVLHKSINNPNR
jgi:beta-lactamase regulating signal transducer with metallopeptidase domain